MRVTFILIQIGLVRPFALTIRLSQTRSRTQPLINVKTTASPLC